LPHQFEFVFDVLIATICIIILSFFFRFLIDYLSVRLYWLLFNNRNEILNFLIFVFTAFFFAFVFILSALASFFRTFLFRHIDLTIDAFYFKIFFAARLVFLVIIRQAHLMLNIASLRSCLFFWRIYQLFWFLFFELGVSRQLKYTLIVDNFLQRLVLNRFKPLKLRQISSFWVNFWLLSLRSVVFCRLSLIQFRGFKIAWINTITNISPLILIWVLSRDGSLFVDIVERW